MKQSISRRKFAQVAGAAVVLAPEAWSMAGAAEQAPAQQSAASQDAPPKPKYGMTPEQEKQVAEAIARRERQAANFRTRSLAYALEPAFVFRARTANPRNVGRKVN